MDRACRARECRFEQRRNLDALLPSLLHVVYLFTRRRGEMGPCGKPSRPFSSLPHPPSATFLLAEKDASPTAAVTLARFLRASSSRTRSGRSRSFPLISRSEFHRRRRWPPLVVYRRRIEVVPGRKKGGGGTRTRGSGRNSMPLVSKTRFSETIRHRMRRQRGEKEIPQGMGGREERREPIRRSPLAKDRGFSIPLRVHPENT